jgi:hypothetical protein
MTGCSMKNSMHKVKRSKDFFTVEGMQSVYWRGTMRTSHNCRMCILLAAFLTFILWNATQADFEYERSVQLSFSCPYPVAVDRQGGLYIGSFDQENTSLYYIREATEKEPSIQKIKGFSSFPPGRGLQGICVDSKGNSYVTGDLGTDSLFQKIGPAPTFLDDASFKPEVKNQRFLGCCLLDDEIVLVTTLHSLRAHRTKDGSYIAGAYEDNESYYQRDIAASDPRYDVYVTRNGSPPRPIETKLMPGSVALWSGASPKALESYSGDPKDLKFCNRITNTFIDNIANRSRFGSAAQGIGFYDQRNLLFVNNIGEKSDDRTGFLDVYEVIGSGKGATATMKWQLNGKESGTALGDILDAVMHDYGDAERLFITDYYNNRLVIYKWRGSTAPENNLSIYLSPNGNVSKKK